MSGSDTLDKEAPDPPWRPRSDTDSRPRRGTFRRLSERTPLRTKLIVALLGLVIVALAAIGVASTYIARESLIRQHDAEIESTLNHPNMLGHLLNSGINIGNAIPTLSNIVVGVQDPGRQLTWAQGDSLPGLVNTDPLPQLPTSGLWSGASAGDISPIFSAPAQSGPNTWRVTAETLPANVGGTNELVIVVVAEDIGNIDALTTRLVLFDLAVGSAIVIVLAIVGVGVVRANLRPLDDIELTAGQIAKGHLDHRVPEGDPRTEVGSLGRSLNAMLAQIERAFHAQQESEQAAHDSEERMRRFIADASHELRTPLTTIRGFAAHYRMRGGAGGRRSDADGGAGGRRSDADGGAGGRRSDVGAAGSGGAAVGGAVGFGGGAEDQSSRTDALVPGSADGIFSSGPADDGMSPADLDHLIGRVEAEATRMGLLVEDLLMLARLDQQRPLNIAPVDVLTLAADAVQDARIVSPGRPIDLIVAPGTAFLVEGDEPRLRQVLANLVNNAITHTPAGTPVRVKIASGTLDKPHAEPVPAVVLDVEDDGPGMSAEQAQRVFERFYRADAARNRASGGTGLGLAIVAGLVNAHGGTVSVRTAPGRGADFQVRLPLSPDALHSSDDPDDALSD
jgi:two-component system OmpR family sensor kinase